LIIIRFTFVTVAVLLLLALMVAVATTQAFIGEDADNLTEYYVACGKPIPDLSVRAGIFEAFGLGSVADYFGSANQNTQLLAALKARQICPEKADEVAIHKVIFIQGIHSGTTYDKMQSTVGWLQNLIALNPALSDEISTADFHFFSYLLGNNYELEPGEEYSHVDTCWSIDNKDNNGTEILGTSRFLEVLVNQLKRENTNLQTISILGHSMGGVMATYSAENLSSIVPNLNIITFDSPLTGLTSLESTGLDVARGCQWERLTKSIPELDSALDLNKDNAVIQSIKNRPSIPDSVKLFTLDADPGWVTYIPENIFDVDPATLYWRERHEDIRALYHSDIWSGLLLDVGQFDIVESVLVEALDQWQAASGTIRPDPPEPSSPGTQSAPGQALDSTTPWFFWNASAGADSYNLYIREDPPDGQLKEFPGIITSPYKIPAGNLSEGKQYRWNMTATNSGGTSGISNTLYFHVTAGTSSPTPTPTPTRTATITPTPTRRHDYAYSHTNRGEYVYGDAESISDTFSYGHTCYYSDADACLDQHGGAAKAD
jgi:hypothetical protein